MTVFLIRCIVCQQTQEAATQIEDDEIQDLEHTTDSFEYYGQALQQPMLQVPAVDFGSYGYGTFAAGTWVPTVQAHTELHNTYGDTMGPIVPATTEPISTVSRTY